MGETVEDVSAPLPDVGQEFLRNAGLDVHQHPVSLVSIQLDPECVHPLGDRLIATQLPRKQQLRVHLVLTWGPRRLFCHKSLDLPQGGVTDFPGGRVRARRTRGACRWRRCGIGAGLARKVRGVPALAISFGARTGCQGRNRSQTPPRIETWARAAMALRVENPDREQQY